jgi:hypothetical protein
VDESSHPNLHDHAHAAIVIVVTVSGRQVPVPLVESATQLLTELWQTGLRHGVNPSDWQTAVSLPSACLDVLTLVEGRGRDH